MVNFDVFSILFFRWSEICFKEKVLVEIIICLLSICFMLVGVVVM